MVPLISIITLTYNHEKFISQCIESCLKQSYKNWEQIIIDDGSTDKTQEIIMKYRDPRIKYFYQSHKGPNSIPESYNKALKISKGEYISILEGDDFSSPDKLQLLLEPFKKKKEIVLSYGLTQEITKEGIFTHKIIPRRFKYLPSSILFFRIKGRKNVKTSEFIISAIVLLTGFSIFNIEQFYPIFSPLSSLTA